MTDIGVALVAFTCSAWLLAFVSSGGVATVPVRTPITCTAENFASVVDPDSVPIGKALLYTVYDPNGNPMVMVP